MTSQGGPRGSAGRSRSRSRGRGSGGVIVGSGRDGRERSLMTRHGWAVVPFKQAAGETGGGVTSGSGVEWGSLHGLGVADGVVKSGAKAVHSWYHGGHGRRRTNRSSIRASVSLKHGKHIPAQTARHGPTYVGRGRACTRLGWGPGAPLSAGLYDLSDPTTPSLSLPSCCRRQTDRSCFCAGLSRSVWAASPTCRAPPIREMSARPSGGGGRGTDGTRRPPAERGRETAAGCSVPAQIPSTCHQPDQPESPLRAGSAASNNSQTGWTGD